MTLPAVLDDETKSMMRNKNLVVGFVWKVDREGRIYMAGSKLVQFKPQRETKRTTISHTNLREDYSLPVTIKEEPYLSGDEETSWLCNSQNQQNFSTDPGYWPLRERIQGKTYSEKILRIRKRLEKPRELTCSRYAVYRSLILRCRSTYQSRGHPVPQDGGPDTTGLPGAAQGTRTPRTAQQKLSAVRALSSRLARLRARLRVCRTRQTADGTLTDDFRLLDMLGAAGESDEEEGEEDESDIHERFTPGDDRQSRDVRNKTGNWKRKRVWDDTGTDDLHHDGLGNPATSDVSPRRKILKVKRQREKLREEREQWGCYGDSDSDDEHRERRSQIRARRYKFLKSTKQSKLHQEDHNMEETATLMPQIISVESLSGNNVQAFSWDVPATDGLEAQDFFYT